MTGQYYYWIKAVENGKPYLIMGGVSESESRQKALEMLPSTQWELVRLKTRDISTASAIIRGKRLESGQSLTEASRRQGHDKSVKRRLRQRQPSQGTPIW